MKKLIFPTIIACAAIIIAACDKINGDSNTIVGKWETDRQVFETIYANGETDSRTESVTKKSYWDFKSDGTMKITDSQGKISEYTYSFDEESKSLTIGSTKHDVYEFSKNSLVIIYTQNFIDGTVKPAGRGISNWYTYWIRTK